MSVHVFAGGGATVFHWNLDGSRQMSVPVSPSFVYSLAISRPAGGNGNTSNEVLSAAGSGSRIDVCTNFGYAALSLDCVPVDSAAS